MTRPRSKQRRALRRMNGLEPKQRHTNNGVLARRKVYREKERQMKESQARDCSCNKREIFPAKAVFVENGFEHIVSFMPGFVCERWLKNPSDGGSHGKACVEVLWLVRNELGAVQFTLLSGWYPGLGSTGFEKNCSPMPTDLGYHSPRPIYEEQTPITEKCRWLNNGPCYYDGSTLNAEEPFNILLRVGETALWRFLEKYHSQTFNRQQ